MAVIYDSAYTPDKPATTPVKRFRVICNRGGYGIRTLVMTGTSRKNIFKQLHEMADQGDYIGHVQSVFEIGTEINNWD